MRIRTIKPEFFTHEGLYDIERETGLPIRVSFAGLWCAADREGRFKWEPRRLGVSILPYDGVEFSRVLDACLTRGLLVKYRVGDAWFGAIPSFTKHQVVNVRERSSELPAITAADETSDACATRASRVSDACTKEGKGREGNTIAPKAARERNPLFDALAEATGQNAEQITKSAGGQIGKALAEIKAVAPEITAEQIKERAANYRTHFADVSISPSALAKWWGLCDRPKSGNSRQPDVQRIPDNLKGLDLTKVGL